MHVEIWKDILGYELAYHVSNLGNVRSKDRTILASRLGFKSLRGSIQVRDCHGSPVRLDFDASGEKAFKKRLDKLDGMIAQLQRMRVQYHEMWWSHLRDIEFKKQEQTKK